MSDFWLAARAKTAMRRAGLTGLALLFLVAAIGAAVVGGSILLAARIGPANASFVVAGALLLGGLVLLLIARLMRPRPALEAAEPVLREIAQAAALRAVDRLSGRQMLFLIAASLLGLSAFLLGADETRKK